MTILLGCIADDFTGATDLAGTLVREGMRSVQMIGVPSMPAAEVDAEAVVVALKSRTIEPDEAIRQSLEALDWLRAGGCERFFFKVCSTFDSTDRGNIGPVAEALLEALGSDFAIACPAFPRNARTVFKGYLFVGDVLLNESGMQDHPLTPMTDPNLVRVLARQTKGEVGLIGYEQVRDGPKATAAAFEELRAESKRFAIVDATDDTDLRTIGTAAANLPLIVGGSGVAIGLPENFRRQGLLPDGGAADALPAIAGAQAVISGSCSRMTQQQVAAAKAAWPAFQVDALVLAEGRDLVAEGLAWARGHLGNGPLLVYATADPDTVRAAQEKLGVERASSLVEDALAGIAKGLVGAGVRRLIVAGGETSGAVVRALGVQGLRIGAEIDPGVPWTATLGEPALALALKSGNFGTPDFFLKAFGRLS
ncbi:MAG: four-carbon acid sugar kinase family protein [Kiloniellales bacterium]|nr:four-carbon acid sugar kinase family protein [Kiloniellales bacterium]